MRILLADNHAIVRVAFKRLLEQSFEAVEFGEAEDGQQAISAALAQPWDLVLLEIAMSDGSMEVLKTIHEQRPGIPVLVVSMHVGQSFLTRAIQAGAAGYLDKAGTSHDLITAIKQVLSGRRYISPRLVEQREVDLNETTSDRKGKPLSDREFEVMLQIASGKTVGEIARKLELSGASITTYRRRILDKLRMTTNADLMRHVMRQKMIA